MTTSCLLQYKSFCLRIFPLMFIVLVNTGLAQNASRMRESMEQLAREKGYGILFCAVDSTAVTAMTTDFKGLIEVNIRSDRMDTLLTKNELKTAGGQKALMELAQQLVKQGVTAREKRRPATAVFCYRLPLMLTCRANDRTGMRIVSVNTWFATNDLKGAAPNSAEARAQQLLENDAKDLAEKFGAGWDGLLADPSTWDKDIFLAWHRIALFARHKPLSTAITLRALNRLNELDAGTCLTALLEELAATQTWEILQQAVTDEAARKETQPFQRLWAYYQQLRSLYTQDPKGFTGRMRECLYQFEVIRGSVASAGGSFGHKLSYFVSDYLQLTGRDLALLYALDGDMLSALQTAERVRARSLGDWIARSHASNRLEPFNIRDQNATQPFFNSLKVASLNEMADVAASQQANLLIYLNTQIGYLTWLIRPNGTYYAAIVPGGDSLVLASLQALPFGVPINRATRGIAINARSVIKGAAKKSTTDVNAALRTLYQQLLPDSLGVAVADGSAPHLIIVPDGQLNLVPFAALQTPAGSYLLQQASLSYAPSVSSLLLIASSEKVFEADKRYPAGKGPISIWGNPDFKGRYSTTVNGAAETVALSPLPGTAKEVGAIAQLFNASAAQQQAVLTDSVLTRSKVNILHLATHGFANMEDGMQSFVAFSDGPLYAEQLYEQAGVLKAKMVVLSACETGLGYISKDSPIGLTTAFLVGGANSVVSTLWSIDDDASAELMVQFYQQLQQGRDIPAALQAAQLSLLKNPRWASPVFWAAFKQTGSVQNPIR